MTMIFVLKFSPFYGLSRDIKEFVIAVTIKLKINTMQTRSSKNLTKYALWTRFKLKEHLASKWFFVHKV